MKGIMYVIKQEYNYKYFYDNFLNSISMYKRYNKMMEEKYRYSIIVTKNINDNKVEIYRSDSSLSNIIKQLDNMTFQEAKIRDYRQQFPKPIQYKYTKFQDIKSITTEYHTEKGCAARYNEQGLIYKYWSCSKPVASVRMTQEDIYIFYNGIYKYYYFDSDEIKVHKSVPLNPGYYIKYDRDCKEMIEKLLKKLMRDNKTGFYDDMVQMIKDKFQIA
ncbi:MAG: hypothetical protein ACRCX2_19405 [Paraclostridium sp.]